jgi:hypothetical protein
VRDVCVLVNVVQNKKVVCLLLNHQPSVCVGVLGEPGRRLGVEVTTQDYVWCVGNVCDVWYVVWWYCVGGWWRNVCVGDCYV